MQLAQTNFETTITFLNINPNTTIDFKMVTLHVNSSYGIASARHCTCVQHPEAQYVFDVPIGMSVCRWEMDSAKRSLFFQAHSDAIMGMRASPNIKYIVTASYSGEVKIWSMDWKLLATQQAPTESVSYVSQL